MLKDKECRILYKRNSLPLMSQCECRSAVEQYKGMCVRYYQWSGWEFREESKKTMD